MSFDPRPDWSDLAGLIRTVTANLPDENSGPDELSRLYELRHRIWVMRDWQVFVYTAILLHDDAFAWARRCQRRLVPLAEFAFEDIAGCPRRWLNVLARLSEASRLVDLVRKQDRTEKQPASLFFAAVEFEAAAWGIDDYLNDQGASPAWKALPYGRHP